MERARIAAHKCRMNAHKTPAFRAADGKSLPALRPKLRTALELMASEGMSQRNAAERAGIDESSVWRALRKEHVRAEFDAIKLKAIADTEPLRKMAKAQAIRVGLDLMQNAKSEAVRARMVEFFAGEMKQPLVNLSLSPAQDRPGYEFARPVQTIDAKPVTDAQSGDDQD